MRSFHGQAERRVDPEDGKVRTFQELEALCAGIYSPAEIREYWETVCLPIEGEGMHNVANDPFLTHTRPRPQPQPSRSLRTRPPAAEPLTNVAEDPFLTHGQRSAKPREEAAPAGPQAPAVPWPAAVASLLGPGDPDRKQAASTVMVFGPWLVYMWVMLLWLLLQHYSSYTTMFLTVVLALGSAGLIAMWHAGKRWGPVSLLALGGLCLLATVGGAAAGSTGWDRFWRLYWWSQTGHRFKATTAATPAGARLDAALLDFFAAPGVRYNGTAVDHLKSAGFKDGHIYCVAPVLSEDMAASSLIRVNYWAVGVDCCHPVGGFQCDAARDHRGGYGVVMLDGGYPCPGCHAEQFKAAIAKAEALHGLVSAKGALLVRWVQDARAAESALLWQALLFVLLSGTLGFVAAALLGSVAWYYGIGKRGSPIAFLSELRPPLMK